MPDAQGFVANFQRKVSTTNAQGQVLMRFNPGYPTKPVCMCQLEDPNVADPVVFKVLSWIQDGAGNYNGVIFQGYLPQPLPASILTLASLQGFDIFGGPPPVGVICHLYAADST